METKFLELPKEKQMSILCAGMEYFGKYGYKHAHTDDIAARANISKGLLFYYFKNKKNFYLYIFHFCEQVLANLLDMNQLKQFDDFFDIIEYGTMKKLEMCRQYPYMADFIAKAFYSQKESISEDMNQIVKDRTNTVFQLYFQYADLSRFKEEIDPQEIFRMLMWLGEGYLFEKQKFGEVLSIEEMSTVFLRWEKMFKKMCYKEEFQ